MQAASFRQAYNPPYSFPRPWGLTLTEHALQGRRTGESVPVGAAAVSDSYGCPHSQVGQLQGVPSSGGPQQDCPQLFRVVDAH